MTGSTSFFGVFTRSKKLNKISYDLLENKKILLKSQMLNSYKIYMYIIKGVCDVTMMMILKI